MPEINVQGQNYTYYTVSIKRVAKVTAGAKRLRMSVLVVVGDKNGKVGVALARGRDVAEAVNKAIKKAIRKLIEVPITDKGSIPFRIEGKLKSAYIVMKPAPEGVGLVAGGSVRNLFEVAGYRNVVAKRLGAPNPIANVYCALTLLHKLSKKAKDANKVSKNS